MVVFYFFNNNNNKKYLCRALSIFEYIYLLLVWLSSIFRCRHHHHLLRLFVSVCVFFVYNHHFVIRFIFEIQFFFYFQFSSYTFSSISSAILFDEKTTKKLPQNRHILKLLFLLLVLCHFFFVCFSVWFLYMI